MLHLFNHIALQRYRAWQVYEIFQPIRGDRVTVGRTLFSGSFFCMRYNFLGSLKDRLHTRERGFFQCSRSWDGRFLSGYTASSFEFWPERFSSPGDQLCSPAQ